MLAALSSYEGRYYMEPRCAQTDTDPVYNTTLDGGPDYADMYQPGHTMRAKYVFHCTKGCGPRFPQPQSLQSHHIFPPMQVPTTRGCSLQPLCSAMVVDHRKFMQRPRLQQQNLAINLR